MQKKSIENICKKHPSWANVFTKYYKIEGETNLNYVRDLMLKIITHKKLLNHLGINIKYALDITKRKDHRSLLEILDDDINRSLFEHKINHFILSLHTKGYQHLFNKEVDDEIRKILHAGISIKAFKKDFIRKIAYFKDDNNSSNLINSLKIFKEKNIHWNKEYYLNMARAENILDKIDILYEKSNALMIHIKDYYSCKILGAESWCIVQREDVFNNYTKDLKRQLIFLDFNRPIEDPKSLIGFTVDVNGDIHYSYLRNDYATPNAIKNNFLFDKLDNDTLYEYLSKLDSYKRNELIFQYGLFEMSKLFISKNQDCTEFLLFAIKKEQFLFVEKFIHHFKNNFCPKRILSEFFPKIGNSHMTELCELESHVSPFDPLFQPIKVYSSYPIQGAELHQFERNNNISEDIISGIIAWIDLLCQSKFIVSNIPSIDWIKDDNRFPYKEVQDRLIGFYVA